MWLAQEGGPAKKAVLPNQSEEPYLRAVTRALPCGTVPSGAIG